jgi:hypothetical protein
MNAAFRRLRRQGADATKNADSLKQVNALREAALASAKLEPARAASIPEAKRKQWIADYQTRMHETIETIGQLEVALKENRNDDAVKLIQLLNSQQRDGHKEYRVEEKK